MDAVSYPVQVTPVIKIAKVAKIGKNVRILQAVSIVKILFSGRGINAKERLCVDMALVSYIEIKIINFLMEGCK